MDQEFVLKRHDGAPSIRYYAKNDDGTAMDLTGYTTVTFSMRKVGSNSLAIYAPAVLEDAANGVLRYDWGDTDTAVAASYTAEFEAVDPSGKIRSFPRDGYLRVKVLADINDVGNVAGTTPGQFIVPQDIDETQSAGDSPYPARANHKHRYIANTSKTNNDTGIVGSGPKLKDLLLLMWSYILYVVGSAIVIYVDAANGDDANAGTSAHPLKTWPAVKAAVERYAFSAAPVIVVVATGTYGWQAINWPKPLTSSARKWIVASGAVVVGSGTLSGPASGNTVPLPAASTNLYRGATLRITSGPQAGYRKTILKNSLTTATLAYADAIAAGSAYVIERPSVVFNLPAGVNVDGFLDAGPSPSYAPMLVVNVAWQATEPVQRLIFDNSCVHLIGCELRWDGSNGAGINATTGVISAGLPAGTFGAFAADPLPWFADVPSDVLSVPSVQAVTGCGLYQGVPYGYYAPFFEIVGQAVGAGTLVGEWLATDGDASALYAHGVHLMTAFQLSGKMYVDGHFECDSTDGSYLFNNASAYFSAYDNAGQLNLPGTVDLSENVFVFLGFRVRATLDNVTARGSAAFEAASNINSLAINTAGAPGSASVRALGGARVTLPSAKCTIGSRAYGVDVRGGGRCFLTGDPTGHVVGTTAAFICDPAGGFPASDLATSFSGHDKYGSVIARAD